MKICACNNCGCLYEDMNPKAESREYPDEIALQKLRWISDTDEVPLDELEGYRDSPVQWFWGCPTCDTDSYLSDDIENYVEKAKGILMAALVLISDKEEYIEEHITGWDSRMNLVNLIENKQQTKQ